jgi:hypothetical protein
MGYHACLLGALASDWAKNPEEFDWIKASSKGVKLARKLHTGSRPVDCDIAASPKRLSK